jgi:hypothetical protein
MTATREPPIESLSTATSCFGLADTQRAKLVPGRWVRVNHRSPSFRGWRGVIVTPREGQRIGDGDCAVLLDHWDYPLGFFWCELEADGGRWGV